MCGIAGCYHRSRDYRREEGYWRSVLTKMNSIQKHRVRMKKVFFWRSIAGWPRSGCLLLIWPQGISP